MSNIRTLRSELKAWGRFWSGCTDVGGYSAKSNVERIKEHCQLGGWFCSDAHLYSNGADALRVPEHIEILTARINRLSVHEKLVLVGFYKNAFTKFSRNKSNANYKVGINDLVRFSKLPNEKSVLSWLLKAENKLL